MWKLAFIFVACFFVSVKCIATSQRISGGETASINEYPFATSLLTNGGVGAEFLQQCGGSILTANSIISAASCFFTTGTINPVTWWRARVGSSLSTAGGTVHEIRLITPHPDFNFLIRDNDLAILRTTININLQPGVAQVAFIAGAVFTLAPFQPISAIGWGALTAGGPHSPQLRQVQFWIVDQDTCATRYNEHGFTVTSNMVCAGWLDVGVRGQCEGDNGSPLVDNGVVVAIHSWTQGCAAIRYPSINTRISPYTRWIVDTAVAP